MSKVVAVNAVNKVVDGDVVWAEKAVRVPDTGLPVNLIVGQTGSGKTSVIQMMGGGSPKTTTTASDTKRCSIYEVVDEDKGEFLMLDTVGLLDTASTDEARMTFIRDLVKYIKDNNLNVCKAFFTVPLGGKQMTQMADWISTLLVALGGLDKVGLISCWLLTKWNQDSKFSKRMCEQDQQNPNGTYNTLVNQKLGFEIVKHGEDNQKELFSAMVAKTSPQKGLPVPSMNPHAEHYQNMARNVINLQEGVNELKDGIARMRTSADFESQKEQLCSKIDQAAADLAGCGKDDHLKSQYRQLISQATQELKDCDKAMKDNSLTREQKEEALRKLNRSFQDQLDELKKRESLMVNLSDLVGVATNAATVVYNFVSKL